LPTRSLVFFDSRRRGYSFSQHVAVVARLGAEGFESSSGAYKKRLTRRERRKGGAQWTTRLKARAVSRCILSLFLFCPPVSCCPSLVLFWCCCCSLFLVRHYVCVCVCLLFSRDLLLQSFKTKRTSLRCVCGTLTTLPLSYERRCQGVSLLSLTVGSTLFFFFTFVSFVDHVECSQAYSLN
jgi:hypothetical protein